MHLFLSQKIDRDTGKYTRNGCKQLSIDMPAIYKICDWIEVVFQTKYLAGMIHTSLDTCKGYSPNFFICSVRDNNWEIDINVILKDIMKIPYYTGEEYYFDHIFSSKVCNKQNNNIYLRELDWEGLSQNPAAIHLLETYPSKIHWGELSRNPNAIHLLEANMGKIHWKNLCKNPNAIHLLEANIEKINWKVLSKNPNAIHLLEANMNKIDWDYLSMNTNAIHLLEANQDKISWYYLSQNPNAIRLLEDNPGRINWDELSRNPNAIHLLEAHKDLIKWKSLNTNPNGLQILKQYPYKLKSEYISKNPAIFELDYHAMKTNTTQLHEELIAYVYHPTHVAKWMYEHGTDSEYLE